MQKLSFDLKLVFRQISRSPGFTATAVLMLAFGIGAATAIFSLVYGVLLRPLSFPDPGRLVTVGDQVQGMNWDSPGQGPVSSPEVISYARDTHSFAAAGGYGYESYELSGSGRPIQIGGARMTSGVFAALGVAPLMGRVFTAQEDVQKAQVVVLSYTNWKHRFGGNRSILGTKILLDRKPYVVIGVMPRNFEFPIEAGLPARCEIWVPMSFSSDELAPEADANWRFAMVARLLPGITIAQSQSDVEAIAERNMEGFPPDLGRFQIRAVVHPLQQVTVREARPLLRILFFAVSVVLLIACVNLAGLLLVRAIRNQREIAVRLALGASAWTLLRQTVLESLILSFAGALLGIVLAALALLFGKGFLPDTLPRVDQISINWPVAGFALLLALVTGLFCGLVPSFAALGTNVNASLKEGGRSGSAGGSHGRLRAFLVVVEIAVAMVLLTASGLLLRSFQKMSAVSLGFDPDHVTSASYSLPREEYGNQTRVNSFDSELLRRLRSQPGVEYAAFTTVLPAASYHGIESFIAEGYSDTSTSAAYFQIFGDFFRTMGIPLLRGRLFSDADNASAQLVVIVNRAFAERYFPGQNPIGRHLRIGTQEMKTPWMTVVGEVGNAALDSPDIEAPPQFFMPVTQVESDAGSFASPDDINGNSGYIVVRSSLPGSQMEKNLRATVASIDPLLPLTEVRTMDQVIAASESTRRFNTAIVTTFAFAAVLLAVLGIYGVVAFSVAARVQEMAIRMALGSQRSGIMKLILISGLRLAAIGCGLGLAGAAAASSLLRSFLFGVSPFDPLVMILAAVAVFLLALLASVLPARRAASVDPLRALRGE